MVIPPNYSYSAESHFKASPRNIDIIIRAMIITIGICFIALTWIRENKHRFTSSLPNQLSGRRIAIIGAIVVSILALGIGIYLYRRAKRHTPTSNTGKINAKDYANDTKLGNAIKCNSTNQVENLISQGADVNLIFGFGSAERTPLQYAAEHGYLELVKILITNGATVNNIADADYKLIEVAFSPLRLAVKNNHRAIAEFLVQKGAWDPCPSQILTDIILLNSNFLLEKFLKFDFDVNIRSQDSGLSALGAAYKINNEKLFRDLIHKGASVDTLCKRGRYDTAPIHNAIEKRWYQVVELLVKKNADLTAENNSSTTPLQRAFDLGNERIAKILIKGRAKLNNFSLYPRTDLKKALKEKGWTSLIQDIPPEFERKPTHSANSHSNYRSSNSSYSNFNYSGGFNDEDEYFRNFFNSFYGRGAAYSNFFGNAGRSHSNNPFGTNTSFRDDDKRKKERLKKIKEDKWRSQLLDNVKADIQDDGRGPTVEYKKYKKRIFTVTKSYELFDLQKTFAVDELKKRYRRILLKFHPDRIRDDAYKTEASHITALYTGTYAHLTEED